ncbi:MAG: DUF2442 domain-containing protein [Flavipsychrobacter sp.]|nr:DUF2442 domain-containing protein [Flavipsychrobacter sp.]
MNTSAGFDTIEQLIFDEKLRIVDVDFHVASDVLEVALSTDAVLQFPLSSFRLLLGAEEPDLRNYEIIAAGTGVHWPALDEDLSLKGFLQEALKQTIRTAAA